MTKVWGATSTAGIQNHPTPDSLQGTRDQPMLLARWSASGRRCSAVLLAGSGRDRDEAHYSPFGGTVSGSANVGGCV